MTEQEIKDMVAIAQQTRRSGSMLYGMAIIQLQEFARLVAAREREACAVLAEGYDTCDPMYIADAIRNRGGL